MKYARLTLIFLIVLAQVAGARASNSDTPADLETEPLLQSVSQHSNEHDPGLSTDWPDFADLTLFQRRRDWDFEKARSAGPWEYETYIDGRELIHLDPTGYSEADLAPFFQLDFESQRQFLELRQQRLNQFYHGLRSKVRIERDGIYEGGTRRLAWGANPLSEKGVRERQQQILFQKMLDYDQTFFRTAKVKVGSNERAIVFKAITTRVFWMPWVRSDEVSRNIRGRANSITLVVGINRHGLMELDFSINRFEGERAYMLPTGDLGAYFIVGYLQGRDFFRDRESGTHRLQVLSVVAREYSENHEMIGVILGYSLPPMVSAANSYQLLENKRTTLANTEDAVAFVKKVVNYTFEAGSRVSKGVREISVGALNFVRGLNGQGPSWELRSPKCRDLLQENTVSLPRLRTRGPERADL